MKEENLKLNILIAGGTGFIGSAFIKFYAERAQKIWVLTRTPEKYQSEFGFEFISDLEQIASDERVDVIINLAGRNLADKRWNDRFKREVVQSRINTTRKLVQLAMRLENKPACFISGSAIGYYGPNNDQVLHESSPYVTSFSNGMCRKWEKEAEKASDYVERLCKIRIGVVLGKHGGAFTELRKSYDIGIASQIGDGNHWFSWIHIDDVIRAIAFLIESDTSQGVFNFTAPKPIRYSKFSEELRQVKQSLFKVTVPSLAIKLFFGEMAEELLLTGQRVIPKRLLDARFKFQYTTIDKALINII